MYVYLYIYIYIVIHRHCFVVSQLFSVARHLERLKLGSENFPLDLVSDHLANKRTTSAREFKGIK